MAMELSEKELKTLVFCLKRQKIDIAGLKAIGITDNGMLDNIEAMLKKAEAPNDTPRDKFRAQTAEFQSRRLMETAMTMQNIYNRMVKDGEIDESKLLIGVYELICDLAEEFEETFFETDEYEDDYVAVIEKWFPARVKEEIG